MRVTYYSRHVRGYPPSRVPLFRPPNPRVCLPEGDTRLTQNLGLEVSTSEEFDGTIKRCQMIVMIVEIDISEESKHCEVSVWSE